MDATLTALAGVTTAADTMEYFTGVDVAASTPFTPLARTLLDDTTQAAMQATIGVVPGTHVQPADATLTAIAGVTTGADTLQFFTGVDTASTTPFSPLARSLLDDTTQAAMQATIGVTGGGGSTTLLGLTDAPDTYTGQATKVLAVRADETGTEFVTPGGWRMSIQHASQREQAQDAIGAMLLDTATIDLGLSRMPRRAQCRRQRTSSITEAKLSLADVTTHDASTTAHGLLRKLSGTATQYLDGSGAWTTPAGGTNYWSRTVPVIPSWYTGLLAWWKLEEASGNRLDSVGTNPLVPQGTVAQITNGAGKIGNALYMNGTAGTHLSVADNATLSAGPNMSVTVSCWVYVTTTGSSMGFVGKGSSSVSLFNMEYMLWQSGGQWHFIVGNGAGTTTTATSSFTPVINQWCLLIGWYDHVADIQYIQVNNGTPNQIANTIGSYDSALPFEVGRTGGQAAQSLSGRLDMVGFWKRVLTAQERSDLYASGAGLDYLGAAIPAVSPLTISDQLLLASTPLTTERLEVDGAIKLGNALGTTDGTLRWTGADFEGRKGGAWVSMTGAGAGAYTDEQAQDAVGTILVDSATIDLTYTDATPSITAAVVAGSIGTTQLADDGVTYAKIQNVSATDRLLGRVSAGAGDVEELVCTAAGRALLDDADNAAQRTTLALGTMAQQDAANVAITGDGEGSLSVAGVGSATNGRR